MNATATLSGVIEGFCDPNLALQGQVFLPVSTLRRAIGKGPVSTGNLWAKAEVNGRPDELVVGLEVVGSGVESGASTQGISRRAPNTRPSNWKSWIWSCKQEKERPRSVVKFA